MRKVTRLRELKKHDMMVKQGSESMQEQNSSASFLEHYHQERKKIEQEIKGWNQQLGTSHRDKLEPFFRFFQNLNQGGKYLRAYLIGLGAKFEQYLPLAVAYEVFQTSILIHDDIIDHADLRRGTKTIPQQYQEYLPQNEIVEVPDVAASVALCLGDYGFFLVEEWILKHYVNHPAFSNILHYYHETVLKTCEGELLDVVLPLEERIQKGQVTEEDIFTIYRYKTARYTTVGPFCLGMLLAGATEQDLQEVTKPLEKMGIAFQIKDDLLGIFGKEDEVGKSNSSDISEYKQTILYSYMLQVEKSFAKPFFELYGKSKITVEEQGRIQKLLIESGAKQYAEQKMEQLFQESKIEIELCQCLNQQQKEELFGFISYLKTRKN